ncbi:MAG: hypothetical protein ABR964_15115 [Tepidisphaeraceae bacterium]
MDHPWWLPVLAVVVAGLAMFFGLGCLFWRLHVLNRGFGPDTLRALGTIIFIPTLLILAIVSKLETSTLSALLGTIAGYTLSNTPPDRKD